MAKRERLQRGRRLAEPVVTTLVPLTLGRLRSLCAGAAQLAMLNHYLMDAIGEKGRRALALFTRPQPPTDVPGSR